MLQHFRPLDLPPTDVAVLLIFRLVGVLVRLVGVLVRPVLLTTTVALFEHSTIAANSQFCLHGFPLRHPKIALSQVSNNVLILLGFELDNVQTLEHKLQVARYPVERSHSAVLESLAHKKTTCPHPL